MYYSSSVIILLCTLMSVESNDQNYHKTVVSTRTQNNVNPNLWISDLFYQALKNFTVRDGSTACQKDTKIYEINLKNYTSWAVRMAESWDHYPIGILGGNRYHLGIYDECVDLHHPIRGQYCLSEIKLTTMTEKDYSFNRTDDLNNFGNNNTWNIILGWVNYPDQVQRNIVNIGICIPYSCSALDLQISLQKELDRVFFQEQIKAAVKVDPIMCTVSGDMYSHNTAYYITCSFLVLLVIICCTATALQYINPSYYQNNKTFSEISNVFSFMETSKELLKFDKNHELNIINGFKVVLMFIILIGHRLMFVMATPMSYSKTIENIYLDGPMIVLTSMNVVDSFFYISGYLTYRSVTPIFLKAGSGWSDIALQIIRRIARLLPAYYVIIAITAYILPELGDGPLWLQKTWIDAEKCKNYWWANVLFISNFIDSRHECLINSWYVSCDIHFYITGVIILYVYSKNIKYGIGLFSVVLGISLLTTFTITFLMKLDGLFLMHIAIFENPQNSITFNESYRPSYMRAIPFLTGLGVGLIVEKLRKKKVKFTQLTVYGGTFIITSICLAAQLYGFLFYKRDRPYNPLENSFYAIINHCTWAVISMCITIFHLTSGYGILTKVLSNRFLMPLGRISYSVFLVNIPIMTMSQSAERLPTYPSYETLVNLFIQDTTKSYILAVLLYLVVEAPFGNLANKLLRRGSMKSLSNSNKKKIDDTIYYVEQEISHL
ncbi:Nose resistant-to-fluoxetine protein, N-terminal,Acyltransferase 3 [Cinara cedri]|uniref:Nose resistant-to-fluoxetine protein, N-terminal,Acyltransferase 3 n=1 Tax=Cinara cedri TaxID=506608 RepID=A0A5E4NEY9_9HEMI|nr:Nose resistant-to-fluoxetine protein, N-terminal,Acyltransferase 3 [Cinara cedri]